MSDAITHRLKVSREGIVLIKSFEGFRPQAVRDSEGRWVIGYGHRASARDGLTVSEEDAELLLNYDLLPVVRALNDGVARPLNQHQFDALASFAISVGVDRFLASDVLRSLNAGWLLAAADALIGWPEPASADALLRRRRAERALFLAEPQAAPQLADLLAAPLPPLPVDPFPASPPVAGWTANPAPGLQGDARAAAIASLLGEAPMPAAGHVASESPAPGDAAPPRPADALTIVHHQMYSPYAGPIIGPLPGFPLSRPEAEGPSDDAAVDINRSATVDAETAAAPPPSEQVAPLILPEPAASPFPPLNEAVVETPPTEADFTETDRAVEDPKQQPGAAVAETEPLLFDDTPTIAVLRHETEPVPVRRFDWGQTGAYLVMGLIGLAACAFSAAAFRKALVEESLPGDFTVIGWVLAFIGVVCIGVSSWHLIRRRARRD